jgi:hypothetical protein
VIVDHTCQFDHFVRTFIMCNIPVWFYWGDHAARYTIPSFDRYMPQQEEFARARWSEKHRGPRRLVSKPEQTHFSFQPLALPADPSPSDNLSDFTASRSPSPSCNLPPPAPGYGQIQGETWREYFARRVKIREYILANETPDEREKRIQVEEARADFVAPGRKGSPVYRWRRNKDGFWLRTLVTRNEVQARWQEFKNSQKKFDSNLKQWDLCKELDPEGDVEVDDDDDQFYNEYMGIDPQTPQMALHPLPVALPSLPQQEVSAHRSGIDPTQLSSV